MAFNRVARGMLHQDHITFAMLLAKISLKGMTKSVVVVYNKIYIWGWRLEFMKGISIYFSVEC